MYMHIYLSSYEDASDTRAPNPRLTPLILTYLHRRFKDISTLWIYI